MVQPFDVEKDNLEYLFSIWAILFAITQQKKNKFRKVIYHMKAINALNFMKT
jgi:hypothetical protein